MCGLSEMINQDTDAFGRRLLNIRPIRDYRRTTKASASPHHRIPRSFCITLRGA